MKKILVALAAIFALSACSGIDSQAPETPKSNKDLRREARGRLTGDDGLLLSGDKTEDTGGPSAIGVNIFLWRATLDTLSFMPITSADPFGGTILTDWYEDPKTPGERFKVNAVILDKTLRADGVKVTVFRQKNTGGSNWRNQKVADNTARALEDTILTRARQLRVAQLGK
ncbi:MAG: DUF3576 domain-containing protein [Alphaproteobacteria bacterium]|nr:DUF3576 domain-containing protein [Alphaproteobacteria bacterium]